MVAVAFSFGAVLFVAELGKPQELSTPGRILVGGFCWIAMSYTILNILGHRVVNDGDLTCGLDQQQLRRIRGNASCRSCLHSKRKFSGLHRKRAKLGCVPV